MIKITWHLFMGCKQTKWPFFSSNLSQKNAPMPQIATKGPANNMNKIFGTKERNLTKLDGICFWVIFEAPVKVLHPVDWALVYPSIHFWEFPKFPNLLISKSWVFQQLVNRVWYTRHLFLFHFCQIKPVLKLAEFQNIMTRIVGINLCTYFNLMQIIRSVITTSTENSS